MHESDIQSFWNRHPCGDGQVGGLNDAYRGDYEAFFRAYDAFRYRSEAHIPGCLDGINFQNKDVLEIGLGEGAESEQIIRRGGRWTGLDLTPESVARVRTRLGLRKLPYQEIRQGSILSAPFADARFDLVFSHGVLHHVPDIRTAQREIRRVLRPDGELVVMLYARRSLNYWVSISVVRRLGLALLYALNRAPRGILSQHLDNARKVGLREYLRMSNFIHRNTDGPLNPYAKVYDLREVEKDFPDFEITRSYQRWMHAPPLPVGWLPMERWLGWHLWVHLRPRP
jgi:SAM-dependent methyltransferase